MAGAAILTLLSAMATGWLCRVLLLKLLATHYPQEYEALGTPLPRQLDSPLPRYQDLHIRFWRYIWGGRAFQLNDLRVSMLARLIRFCDVLLVLSAAAFLWSAWQ